MKLTAAQFDILMSAARGELTSRAAAPAKERTVKSLANKGLLQDWKITEAGMALFQRDYYRQPDDSVIFR